VSKLKRLVIKDCLGIEELAITPGQVNLITGGNEKSKTSILETIEKAFYNTERRDQFVRVGAEKAYIEAETDDGIKIERTVKKDDQGHDTGSVKVTVDGIPQKQPETYLKELFGLMNGSKKRIDVFAFNPVDFMTKKDTEQTDILLSLLPIIVSKVDAEQWFGLIPPVNYDKHGLLVLKALENYWFEARHEANAAVKATKYDVESTANKLPDNYQLQDWESTSLAELYDTLRDAERVNANREKSQIVIDSHDSEIERIDNKYLLKEKDLQDYKEFKLSKARNKIESKQTKLRDSVADIDLEIEQLQGKITQLKIDRATLLSQVENLKTMGLIGQIETIDRENAAKLEAIGNDKQKEIDLYTNLKSHAEKYLVDNPAIVIDPLKFKCEHTEKMKQFIPLAKELSNTQRRLQQQEETALKYDSFVDICRNKPVELLSEVELPLEGLGINENGIVTINGLPLRNLSTSRQVRVCLNIARAHAKNNPLKLICVDRMECMDADVIKEFLKQIEKDNEFQFFLTRVTEGDLKIETRG